MTEQLVPVGEIVATHGLVGWLKVNPFNPETTAIAGDRQLIIEKDGRRTAQQLESSKRNKRQILIKLRGVDGIDDARKWVGAIICVDANALEPLAPGQYYHYQIVGFEVCALSGERIGVITRVWSTPGGELYVVQGPKKEHLVPAVKEIIEKIDFAAGRIIINPPEGLLNL